MADKKMQKVIQKNDESKNLELKFSKSKFRVTRAGTFMARADNKQYANQIRAVMSDPSKIKFYGQGYITSFPKDMKLLLSRKCKMT